MGHVRLGKPLGGKKWIPVVQLIEQGGEVPEIANATVSVAKRGLSLASKDTGLVNTLWLLAQIPLAARSEDFASALRQAGLEVSDAPGLMEIVGAFSEAIDKRLPNNRDRTDLGEMGQMAAAETISKIIGSRLPSLLGSPPGEVQRTFSGLATNEQFSQFTGDFLGRLIHKYIDYFLSRALPQHIGEGKRFATLAEQSEFSNSLRDHCREASRAVEGISAEWLSRENWEKSGISQEQAGRFIHMAVRKISDELKRGGT